MTTPPDYLQLARMLEEIRAEVRQRTLFAAQPATKWSAVGFFDVRLSLADLNTLGPQPLVPEGYQVTYLRRGSAPGGLLKLVGGGQLEQPFGPGDQVTGWFGPGEIQVQLFPGSATTGDVVLRVALNPQLDFQEAPVEVPVKNTALLGAVAADGTLTFTAEVTADVAPTGLAPAGSFQVGGWKRILVYIENSNNLTSFAIAPYFKPMGTASTTWFCESETQSVTFSGSQPSGRRYRLCVIELSGAEGMLYLMPYNVAAPGTGLNYVVVGVA